jgi:hypothetical protein
MRRDTNAGHGSYSKSNDALTRAGERQRKAKYAEDHLAGVGFVQHNAIDTELFLRITTGKPALARWVGQVETKVGLI